MRRWGTFAAPGQSNPVGETGTVSTTPMISVTGGVRQITTEWAMPADVLDNWGILTFRSLTTGFTTSFDNLVHVQPAFTDNADETFLDTPLDPATYFYNYRLFTDDGLTGPELGEESATAT